MVVGGGTIKTDECEYFGVLAGVGDEALSQGFGLVIGKGVGADAIQDGKKPASEFFPGFASPFGSCITIRVVHHHSGRVSHFNKIGLKPPDAARFAWMRPNRRRARATSPRSITQMQFNFGFRVWANPHFFQDPQFQTFKTAKLLLGPAYLLPSAHAGPVMQVCQKTMQTGVPQWVDVPGSPVGMPLVGWMGMQDMEFESWFSAMSQRPDGSIAMSRGHFPPDGIVPTGSSAPVVPAIRKMEMRPLERAEA
jgi:hypothetical protein